MHGWGVKLVPVHPAGDIDVVHEALYVQWQIGRVGTHQLLQFLALLVQPQQSPWVVPHIELVLALKLLAEVIYQHLIEIAPTKVGVKRRGEDLKEQNNELRVQRDGVGEGQDGESWETNFEFPFVEGSDGDLERWMSHVHEYHISWPLFWSRKVLFVDPISQSHCL